MPWLMFVAAVVSVIPAVGDSAVVAISGLRPRGWHSSDLNLDVAQTIPLHYFLFGSQRWNVCHLSTQACGFSVVQFTSWFSPVCCSKISTDFPCLILHGLEAGGWLGGMSGRSSLHSRTSAAFSSWTGHGEEIGKWSASVNGICSWHSGVSTVPFLWFDKGWKLPNDLSGRTLRNAPHTQHSQSRR